MKLDEEKCPRCEESYADGMVKVMGVPKKYKESLNEVRQCLKCKFIFSPKTND